MEAITIVSIGTNILVVLLVGAIYKTILGRFKINEEDTDGVKSDIKEIEGNYLSRFETVNKNIANFREETNVTLARIEIRLEQTNIRMNEHKNK